MSRLRLFYLLICGCRIVRFDLGVGRFQAETVRRLVGDVFGPGGKHDAFFIVPDFYEIAFFDVLPAVRYAALRVDAGLIIASP